MLFDLETLLNCVCFAFIGAAFPIILFEVAADIKENKEEREDRYFSNGEWRHK